ncbi:MAG: tripartite tricarboxylate transporter substrate binding protein, partial [Delftia acidovorans]|nr:tripartite tricarboxylate transporter substrate binding protein [Delftia acidovorans]
VVVENRPGASGNIGARQVSKARPDGYTLLICTTAQTISGALYTQAGYDVVNDLEAISTINDSPLVLITRPGLQMSSVQDLIELARRSPGKLTYATPGYGSAGHMAAEALSLAADIRMLHIPYQGAAPMMADLVSGQVDIAFDLLITAKQYVSQGKVNRVGVATRERSPLMPDWQTLSEQSPARLGNFNETAWNVLMAPKGTPAAIVNAINAQMKNILADEKVQRKFMELGSIPLWKSVGGTKAFVSDDARKWRKVVSDAGIAKI